MNWGVLVAVLLILVELMVVTAVAVLFSTFSTPTLSAMLTLGVWVIGRFSSDLIEFARKTEDPVTRAFVTGVHYLLPEPREVRRQAPGGLRHGHRAGLRRRARWRTGCSTSSS